MIYRLSILPKLALVTFLLAIPLSAYSGTTYNYPKDKPAMSMEIPDGWKAEEGNTGLHQLILTRNDAGTEQEIKILTLPARYAEGSMADALKKVIDLTTKDPNFTDVQIGTPRDDKMPTGMAVALSKVTCKVKGVDWNYLFVIFSPVAGTYCELVTATPEGKPKTAEKAAQQIVGSILLR